MELTQSPKKHLSSEISVGLKGKYSDKFQRQKFFQVGKNCNLNLAFTNSNAPPIMAE